MRGDKPAAETVTDEAAQNAAQRAHAEHCGESHVSNTAHEKTPALLGLASSSEITQLPRVAGTGFEVPLVFRGKNYILTEVGDASGIYAKVCSERV